MAINPNSKLYRLATMMRSMKAIYQLTPAQVESFIDSYEIYDCDWVDGQAVKGKKKIDYQKVKQNVLSWYGVINYLCSIGQVEKMYIPPALDESETVINNQVLFEKRFCKLLDIKTNDKVFEMGCGRGRVAAHIASLSGAKITAINIDQIQLDHATQHAKKAGLSKQCKFINADLNDLPYPYADETFDAIYEIQALSLCRDIPMLFSELNRILKPGGKISLLEWVRLPRYDANNKHHRTLMKKIKPFIGAIGTPSPEEYEAALQQAGFEVLVSEDPSVNKSQVPMIERAGTMYNRLMPILRFLVKIRLIPKHFVALINKLQKDVEAYCEADKEGLVTMCYHLVAEKKR